MPVTLGDLTPPGGGGALRLLLTLWLTARQFTGALLVGIMASTALAIAVNASTGGRAFPLPGQACAGGAEMALPDFSSLGAVFDFSVSPGSASSPRWSRSSR